MVRNYNSNSPLVYRDERDRSRGLAGMAIMLIVSEEEPVFDMVSLDEPVGNALTLNVFTAESQSIAACQVPTQFRQHVREFMLGTRAMFGNVLARSIADNVDQLLTDSLTEQGVAAYSLEDDEAHNLIRREYSQATRVFSNPTVGHLVSILSDTLAERRHMSRREIVELLRSHTR